MGTLLYIKASPRGRRSRSIAVADAFIDAFTQSNPDNHVDTLDLFREDLPAFDGPALEAKYAIMHGQEADDQQQRAWTQVESIIGRFTSADRYVFAVPMWNFGIPYRLKQYVDIIVQPTYTFAVTENGYQGLLSGKQAFIAAARGGDYTSPGAEVMDFQIRYVETILGFVGITDIKTLVVQPTLAGGPETAQKKLDKALEDARTFAAGW